MWFHNVTSIQDVYIWEESDLALQAWKTLVKIRNMVIKVFSEGEPVSYTFLAIALL